jgi:acyl-CoA thioester hydrolase
MPGELQHLVAYADTDAGGVMYHGRYVELAERSRLLALHQWGWTMARLQAELGLKLVVHRLDARFQRPARLEQWLQVSTQVHELSPARCLLRTLVQHQGQRLASLTAQLVGLHDGALTRLPSSLLQDLGRDAPRPPSALPSALSSALPSAPTADLAALDPVADAGNPPAAPKGTSAGNGLYLVP